MSGFFKNVWFRCISVLLLIALVSGGLLAVLNDVLYVSDEERTGRAIKKIYGEQTEYSVVLDADKNADDAVVYEKYGKIEKYFNVGSDMLFKVTGMKGYKDGTVTLWVKVADKNGKKVIDKVILESFEKQTLMSKLDGTFYDRFLVDVTDGYFTSSVNAGSGEISNPVTGATKSATAAVNAVNCVIKYVNSLSGGEQ